MQKTYANPFMGPFCPFWQKCVFLEILLLPFFTIIDLVSLYQIKKKIMRWFWETLVSDGEMQ